MTIGNSTHHRRGEIERASHPLPVDLLAQLQFGPDREPARGARGPPAGARWVPVGGRRVETPGAGRCRRERVGAGPSSAALTSSIGSRCGGDRPGCASALTAARSGPTRLDRIDGVGRRGDRSSVTAGMIGRPVVGRGTRAGAGRPGPSAPCRRLACLPTRSVADPFSVSGRLVVAPFAIHWPCGRRCAPSACRGSLGRACRAEHIRLDQVIPAAGSAYLHHVDRELLEPGRQQHQLFGGAGRARHRTQMVAEHPRHQRELFLAADRAHHLARFPVKLRGAQQVRVGVTHLGDTGAARVHLGQQGAPPKRVVHHLSLQSHADQSTSPSAPPIRKRGRPPMREPNWRTSTIICVAKWLGAPLRGGADDGDPRQGQRPARRLQDSRQRSQRRPALRWKSTGNASAPPPTPSHWAICRRWSTICRPTTPRCRLPALSRSPGRRFRRLGGCGGSAAAFVASVLLGVGIGWGLYGNTSSPLDFTSDPGAKPDGVAPGGADPAHAAAFGRRPDRPDGADRKRFGDTMGYRLVVYPTYAPGPPGSAPTTAACSPTTTAAGWGDPTSSAKSGADGPVAVDLGKFDITATVGIMRGAPETLAHEAVRRQKHLLDRSNRPTDPTTPGALSLVVVRLERLRRRLHRLQQVTAPSNGRICRPEAS